MNPFVVSILSLLLVVSSTGEVKDERTEFFPKEELKAQSIPDKENVWVFALAGQSNMAGRGKVEPNDTLPNNRILSINKSGDVIIAKEPLHFYEPSRAGLDCGLSFGKELLKHIPDSISILIIPTAVGGSSISHWINDSHFKDVSLFSNFREKVAIGKKMGEFKGILWHQGETDAYENVAIDIYHKQLKTLFTLFRNEIENDTLPIIVGELGSFSTSDESWQAINAEIKAYIETDSHAYLVKTSDLNHKGDEVHFDSEGLRLLGQRYAKKYVELRE